MSKNQNELSNQHTDAKPTVSPKEESNKKHFSAFPQNKKEEDSKKSNATEHEKRSVVTNTKGRK
jgi:hypothetical protein